MTRLRATEDPTARIGSQLRAMRTARDLRVSELARRVGVSPSMISQIEGGVANPSVGTLFSMAQALNVPVDAFFAAAPAARGELTPSAPRPAVANDVSQSRESDGRGVSPVVRRNERVGIEVRSGVRWERLALERADGIEFLSLTYSPGAESDSQLYRHFGTEFVLVTEGILTILLDADRYDLQAGDAISFPSTTPHRYINETNRMAKAVTFISERDFPPLESGSVDQGDPAPCNPPAT